MEVELQTKLQTALRLFSLIRMICSKKKKRAGANPYETATMYARHVIASYLLIGINVKLDLGMLLARRMGNDTG